MTAQSPKKMSWLLVQARSYAKCKEVKELCTSINWHDTQLPCLSSHTWQACPFLPLITQYQKTVCCCKRCCISQQIACQSQVYTNQTTKIKHACLTCQPPECVGKRTNSNLNSSPTIYSPRPAATACRNGHQYFHEWANKAIAYHFLTAWPFLETRYNHEPACCFDAVHFSSLTAWCGQPFPRSLPPFPATYCALWDHHLLLTCLVVFPAEWHGSCCYWWAPARALQRSASAACTCASHRT